MDGGGGDGVDRTAGKGGADSGGTVAIDWLILERQVVAAANGKKKYTVERREREWGVAGFHCFLPTLLPCTPSSFFSFAHDMKNQKKALLLAVCARSA